VDAWTDVDTDAAPEEVTFTLNGLAKPVASWTPAVGGSPGDPVQGWQSASAGGEPSAPSAVWQSSAAGSPARPVRAWNVPSHAMITEDNEVMLNEGGQVMQGEGAA
jgi:hypothetical protein